MSFLQIGSARLVLMHADSVLSRVVVCIEGREGVILALFRARHSHTQKKANVGKMAFIGCCCVIIHFHTGGCVNGEK